MDFDTELRTAVGAATGKALAAQLDLHTVGDLLQHYPRRYAERGQLTDLSRLAVGELVTVMATVHSTRRIPLKQRKGFLLEVIVSDGSNRIGLSFFGQPWRDAELRIGRSGLFAGKVSDFNGRRQLNNPDYVLLDDEDGTDGSAADFAGSLIPVYPATAKLTSWTLARCIKVLLDILPAVADPLPMEILAQMGLSDLDTAVRGIHRPRDRSELAAARRRLAFDEALGIQLVLARRRTSAAVNPASPRPPVAGGLADAFEARLPFELTAGQREVGAEITADLSRNHPMHRLLQGEVGSGKTVVALRAMLQVLDNGAQAALLAPTEVLAGQHARSIEGMLGDLGQAGRFGAADRATRVTLLTGSLSTSARRAALLDAASGAAGIVIGTHALIQKTVEFADLGLVVVDEQHRFGVEQRDALRAKSATPPHLLVMTATPIPRTVAMTVFGDLDTSVLSELPAGRAPITTSVVPALDKPAWLARAWQRVAEEVAAGRQAYVVCTRIGNEDDPATDGDGDGAGGFSDLDPGDGTGPTDDGAPAGEKARYAVLETMAQLAAGPLAGLRIDTLHGRMSSDDKDRVMRQFSAGDIDVLVATTVVEVGVDVPNATVMVILDAERYGVSQLHQLRGRVGRGSAAGLCLLVTEQSDGSPAVARLEAVAATTDGFLLAQLDLEQRREGDVLGAAQSGRQSSLKLLSLLRDEELIMQARDVARQLVADDPDLSRQPVLAERVAGLMADERSRYLDKA